MNQTSNTAPAPGAKHPDVSWAGTADPNVRRRLQNRINQRLSRLRRAAQKDFEHTTTPNKPAGLLPLRPRQIRSKSSDPKYDQVQRSIEQRGLVLVKRSLDPHEATQPELQDPSAKRLLHYTLVILLPTLGTKTVSGEPLPVALHRSALHDIHVLFGVMVGGAGQRLSLTQSDQDTHAFFKVQLKLASLVRRSLEQNSITDGVLFAILALSIKRNDYAASLPSSERYAGGFISPVKSVGGLDWLGGIELAADHIGMLISLIRDRISSSQPIGPGLCEYMQMADLLRASLSLTRPELELSESYVSILNNEARLIRPPPEEAAAFEVDSDLQSILLDMKITCRLVEKFGGRIPFDSQTSKFVQYRDLIQYRLLSLPPGKDDVCRLAAMIFNYGVIFAIPDPRPIRKLTRELQFAMLNSEVTAKQNKNFLLWAAIIGGIAATGGGHYDVFVTLVVQYATALRLYDWSAVLAVLEQFLWLDMACRNGGRDLWVTAVKLMNPSRAHHEGGLFLVL